MRRHVLRGHPIKAGIVLATMGCAGWLATSCATIERAWPPPQFTGGAPAMLACARCHANQSADREKLPAELCTAAN